MHKLFGAPFSYYTAKARSYLIKQGIPFENHAVGHPYFRQTIVPKVHRFIMPVLETPDGQLIQDGSDIIDHFERTSTPKFPAYPLTHKHRIISHIFELFGGEGLLRPAMHYRWNFEENRSFLEKDFPASMVPYNSGAEQKREMFTYASGKMRKAMLEFGVTPESIPTIEASYLEFLDLLNKHFETTPYLLGGRPTLGDYGLIAPLYPHLSRDPHPSAIMKSRAQRVWRWVERMNASDLDKGEYGDFSNDLFSDDKVPETLKDLMRFISIDYLPEVKAYVAFTNDWLAERPNLEEGTSGVHAKERRIGETEFEWRNSIKLRVSVMPYRLYLLQKIHDVMNNADENERKDIDNLLDATGLSPLLVLKTKRRIKRNDFLEVWGAH